MAKNKKEKNYLYCAYGSNINLEQMKNRCPHSYIVGTGYLKGWKLLFNIHADIFYTGNDKDIVPVLIWEISSDDWKKLDLYEGFPNYYVKEKTIAYMDDATEEVIVYVMADKRKGIYPPFKEYFNGIVEGYEENNMDLKYLYNALRFSNKYQTEYNQYYNKKGEKIV